jgi:hypothetical protein
MSRTIRIPLSPVTLSLLAIVVAGAVGSALWLLGLHIDCSSRWKDSGLRAHYRDGTCLVEAGSRWVPERAIRIHVREPG